MRVKIKQRRQELGLSQAKAAEKAGMTRSTWAKLEYGERRIYLEQMQGIAKALKIKFDGSFFENDCSKTEQSKTS